MLFKCPSLDLNTAALPSLQLQQVYQCSSRTSFWLQASQQLDHYAFKTIFTTAAKANSWTTVSWTSSLPLQKIKQLNHYDFKTTFRTAKNKQFYQCVWKVIFTTVEKKVTLRQQVNNCNSFQDMELHYMNMYTTAMHSKSWNCTLHQHANNCNSLQDMELHYMNMYTTAMHSKSCNCTLHQHADDCNAFQDNVLHVCDDSLILVLSRDVNFLLDIIHVRLGHVRIPR